MNSGSIQLPNELSQATIGVESSSYLQTATGTLGIRVTSTDSYSTLKVGGIATFEDDATIEVHAQGASLRKGDRLLGVVTAETVVASSITVTHPNSMFVFAPVYHANSIELNVLQSLSVLTAVTNNGNIKAIPTATVFDDMIANNSGSSDMQNVINAFSNLPDEAAISNAVSKTLPLVTGGLTKNTLNMVRDTSRIISARQESLSGQASGSEFYGNKNFWFKPYASFGSQDDKAGISGFDSKTYGMIFGADQKFTPKDQIGFALNYARANVDANNESTAKQSATSDNYLIALYGSHDLERGRELTYIADVGQQNIRGNRAINIDSLRRTAKADYSSWSGHVGLGLKQTNQWTDNTNFTTSVRYDYAYVKDDAYQEKGADALNLNVNKASMYESLASLDGKISHGLTPSLNLIVNAGLSYDFNNQSTRVNSAFAGAPNLAFTTDGLSYGRLSERLGVGLVNKNSKNFEFSARYDYETRSHYNNQMGSLKAVWFF
jgi:outer membrane autotransporter protein